VTVTSEGAAPLTSPSRSFFLHGAKLIDNSSLPGRSGTFNLVLRYLDGGKFCEKMNFPPCGGSRLDAFLVGRTSGSKKHAFLPGERKSTEQHIPALNSNSFSFFSKQKLYSRSALPVCAQKESERPS